MRTSAVRDLRGRDIILVEVAGESSITLYFRTFGTGRDGL